MTTNQLPHWPRQRLCQPARALKHQDQSNGLLKRWMVGNSVGKRGLAVLLMLLFTLSSNTISAQSCSFCIDGNVTTPDRAVPLSFFKEEDLENFTDLLQSIGQEEPNCALVDLAVATFQAGSEECSRAQQLGAFCGCPTDPDPCILCPTDSMTRPDHYHTNTRVRFGENITCLLLEAVLLGIPRDSDQCFLAQETNWECGCNDGFYGYLGTESVNDQRILSVMSKVSGSLSMLGAAFILQDFFRGDRDNVYRQIVTSMAVFDFITAVCWTIGSWSVPTTNEDGHDANIYGASGNDALCTAQAFFVMLGYGSGFFNNALSVYYILVVVRGWKNHQVHKIRIWLFGFPVLSAVVLACAALPFYAHDWVGCWIQPYPFVESKAASYFAGIPILFTTIVSTTAQIRVYSKVRAVLRKSSQWSSSSNSSGDGNKFTVFSNQAEAAVFWQSFFYLLAYYICWPILLVGVLWADNQQFGFWVTLVTIAPLQGFFNCLVYTRPRIARWTRQRQKDARRKREMERDENAGDNKETVDKTNDEKVGGRNGVDDSLGTGTDPLHSEVDPSQTIEAGKKVKDFRKSYPSLL